MKKYKFTTGEVEKEIEEIELEDKDFLLITAIDNLTSQIRRLVNGR